MGRAAFVQNLHGLVEVERLLVGALRCQRIEHVGNREDPRIQRNFLAGPGFVVTAAVEFRMVISDNRRRVRQPLGALDDIEAVLHVLFHDFEFLVIQAAWLQQNIIRDTDLADIV